jgi:hypothetical protein
VVEDGMGIGSVEVTRAWLSLRHGLVCGRRASRGASKTTMANARASSTGRSKLARQTVRHKKSVSVCLCRATDII